MRDDVEISSHTVLAEAWGKLTQWRFALRRRSGAWQDQVREVYDRGDGAALLLINRDQGTVILTRQFRFPSYYNDEAGALIEVCAGKLDGDDPATCAKKEAEEETGYRIGEVRLAYPSVYMSPGSVTERLWLFVGHYDAGSKVSNGGGHEAEGEDIEVLEMPFAEAMRMVSSGEIRDAKTVLLLQYAALNQLL